MGTFASHITDQLIYNLNQRSLGDKFDTIHDLMPYVNEGYCRYKDIFCHVHETKDISNFSQAIENKYGGVSTQDFAEHAEVEVLFNENIDESDKKENRWLLYKEAGRRLVELNRQRKRTWVTDIAWGYTHTGLLDEIEKKWE